MKRSANTLWVKNKKASNTIKMTKSLSFNFFKLKNVTVLMSLKKTGYGQYHKVTKERTELSSKSLNSPILY